MNKKYKLTHHTKVVEGHTLHRIKALKSFDDVRKGDLGGWVESHYNLSQKGTAWIYDKAKVYDKALVFDNAKVRDHARVYGNAWVYKNAWVYGHARVSGAAGVSGNAWVHGHAKVYDNAKVWGNVLVYDHAHVSGNVHVYDNAKVYGDSILQGRISIREDDDIKDKYSYLIFNNTWSSGRQFVYVLSNQRWHVGCFDGTGDELIKKAYRDSKLSGKMYGLYVKFAELAVKTQQQLQSHKQQPHKQQPHNECPLWLDSFPSWRGWFGL